MQLAEAYYRLTVDDFQGVMITWDLGTGKSHFGMRMGTLMREDDLIDLVIIACEKNKLKEWRNDFERFTLLRPHVYHGPKRMEKLVKDGLPDVLITTFETGRTDLAKKQGPRKLIDGPLLEHIIDRRTLVVFDESTKLKNRSSWNYKAWDRTLTRLRKKGAKVVAMTGTPIESGWEDAYNQLLLINPARMPLVKEFERYFISSRDPFGRPNFRKSRMHEFVDMAKPMVWRKRKTDPDVVHQFPQKVEEARWFEMGPEQDKLYRLIQDLGFDEETGRPLDPPLPGLVTILRQLAGHPAAVVHSARDPQGSKLAKVLVEELGEQVFLDCPSVKTQGLVDLVAPIVHGQRDKVVVFSFYGPSMLPLLRAALAKAKVKTYLHHGAMKHSEQEEAKDGFRNDPEPCVFLTSDAGARGINLPEASYVVQYEAPLSHALYSQRIDRAHRIGHGGSLLTAITFFLSDSVEEGIGKMMNRRNQQQDQLLDGDAGESHMSAAEREELLGIGKKTRRHR